MAIISKGPIPVYLSLNHSFPRRYVYLTMYGIEFAFILKMPHARTSALMIRPPTHVGTSHFREHEI